MTEQPDPITVTLTREEAEGVLFQIRPFYSWEREKYPDDELTTAEAKLRAALDSEATITEEMVEAGTKARWENDTGLSWPLDGHPEMADSWRRSTRICLEAALGEDE